MSSKERNMEFENEENDNTWIMCMKREILLKSEESTDLSIIKLKHPKTGIASLFLLSAYQKKIQEIMSCNENLRSWIVDKKLISSGKFIISTPIDSLFLILPYLVKAKYCSPLNQILDDDEFPETEHLLQCSHIKNINNIADSRGDKNLNAFIYNEEKTMLWLKKKVERVATLLKEKGIHVGNTVALSANFKQSESVKDSKESYIMYAYGMISEYLSEELSSRLAEFLNIPKEEELIKKRKVLLDVQKEIKTKRTKIEIEGKLSNKEKVVKSDISPKDRARAKAAVGTKSILSFFKK